MAGCGTLEHSVKEENVFDIIEKKLEFELIYQAWVVFPRRMMMSHSLFSFRRSQIANLYGQN